MTYTFAGRTTFVNTLCGKKVLQGKDADDATNAHLEEGVKIKPITVGKNYICSANMVQLLTLSQSSSWMRRELASP